MDIKGLFDKRRKAEEQARSLMQKENKSKEELIQVDKWLDEAASAEKEIEQARRLAQIDEKEAAEALAKQQNEKKSDPEKVSHTEKLRRYLRFGEGGDSGGWEGRAAATPQTVTTTGGGYTVPTETMKKISVAMEEMGGMYPNSTVLKTSSGNPINWPTLNDTAVDGALLAINTDNSTLTNTAFTFGQFTLGSFKYSSQQILVPVELLEDSQIDIEALIIDQLKNRLLRGLNALWTTGGGTTTITGVVTSATDSAITGTDDVTVSRANLVDLQHSINAFYRRGAKYMFNDATLKSIKKLSFGTSDDRPLWVPSMREGAPDYLEGFQYIVNPDVASMAADAKSILFGDFSKYYIREIGQWRIKRFEELYGMVDQVSFVIFCRYDGKLDTTGTPIKYMKNALTT